MNTNRHECAAGVQKTQKARSYEVTKNKLRNFVTSRKPLTALRAFVLIRVHSWGNKTKTGHKTGLLAETLAALALMLKGYLIVARRHKTPLGEIDLVARRGNTLAFVEVKWRGTSEEAVHAVHSKNQTRVRDAAALYLQRHPQYAGLNLRFDAMALSPKAWPRHIPNAWE